MKQVIIINGVAESGKDTFVDFVKEYMVEKDYDRSSVDSYSSIDYVKQFASSYLNWNGVKDNKSRKMLSDLKDMFSEHTDIPFREMMRKYLDFQEDRNAQLLFLFVREPEEIDRAVVAFNNAIPILIKRDGIDIPDNHADERVEVYHYAYIVNNNGTLEDLKKEAIAFIDGYLKIEDNNNQ